MPQEEADVTPTHSAGDAKDPAAKFDMNMQNARDQSARLADRRSNEIDLVGQAQRFKLPGVALMLSESLLWRQEELARNAIEAIERRDRVAGALLARAAMETTAMLSFIHDNIAEALEKGDGADLHQKLAGALTGSKLWEDLPGAVHVLKAIDRLDKSIPGYRHAYDGLSELAHPNWAGTYGAYARHDEKTLKVSFRLEDRRDGNWIVVAAGLAGAVDLFDYYFENIRRRIPQLITLGEAQKGAA